MRCAGKSSSMAALTTARPAVALLAAALALLLAAWVFGNPPGAAPDERAHYVRALGAGSLELEGAIFKPTREQTEAFFEQRDGPELPGAGVATVLWAAKQTRTFELPAELSVFGFGCNDQKPDDVGGVRRARPRATAPRACPPTRARIRRGRTSSPGGSCGWRARPTPPCAPAVSPRR